MLDLGAHGALSACVNELSHLDADGRLRMVDVSAKSITDRNAHARAVVELNAQAADALRTATLAKGDAFAAARVAGILAAKKTPELIPLAHAIALGTVSVDFSWHDNELHIDAVAHASAQTGVELEALVAASIAALTIYDMTKSIDKGATIASIRLLRKTGGKSGTYER